MADPKALATATTNAMATQQRQTFRSRPAAQGVKPRGYLKDVNLPVDKPKTPTAGRSIAGKR